MLGAAVGWQGHVEPCLLPHSHACAMQQNMSFWGAQVTNEHAHELAQPVAAHAQRYCQEHERQVECLHARDSALCTAKRGLEPPTR